MIGDAPEPAVSLPSLVAGNTFDPKPGVSALAGEVIYRIRVKRQGAKTDEERRRYSQAFPETVAEVLSQGELKQPALLPASIPPSPGEGPDELLAGIRPPLRSAKMARGRR
jgi:hypothetical protein